MKNNYCVECEVLCNEQFCWRCGRKSINAILKCPYCETSQSVIGKFCGNCGKPIQEAVKAHIQEEEVKNNGSDSGNDTGEGNKGGS